MSHIYLTWLRRVSIVLRRNSRQFCSERLRLVIHQSKFCSVIGLSWRMNQFRSKTGPQYNWISSKESLVRIIAGFNRTLTLDSKSGPFLWLQSAIANFYSIWKIDSKHFKNDKFLKQFKNLLIPPKYCTIQNCNRCLVLFGLFFNDLFEKWPIFRRIRQYPSRNGLQKTDCQTTLLWFLSGLFTWYIVLETSCLDCFPIMTPTMTLIVTPTTVRGWVIYVDSSVFDFLLWINCNLFVRNILIACKQSNKLIKTIFALIATYLNKRVKV